MIRAEVSVSLSVGAVAAQSPLFRIFEARESLSPYGEISRLNYGQQSGEFLALQVALGWQNWEFAAGLQADGVNSPPNDAAKQRLSFRLSESRFLVHQTTISNAASYRLFASAGYRFNLYNDRFFAKPLVRVRSTQEDFEFESLPLQSGAGVAPFRIYDRRHLTMEMGSTFHYQSRQGTIEIEPYASIASMGSWNSSGTSFDHDGSLLFEELDVPSKLSIAGIYICMSIPIQAEMMQRSDRLWVFIAMRAETVKLTHGGTNGLYLGASANQAILRDLALTLSSKTGQRQTIGFGLRIDTAL